MSLSSGLMTVSQLGTSNRVGLLYSLAANGPSSRSELARLAGVPRGSIAPIVAGLLDDQLLVEQDPSSDRPRMGKPSRPLWFGPRIGHSGTVLLEAGLVECARVDQRGVTQEVQHRDLAADATREQIEAIVLELTRTVFAGSAGPLTGIGLVWPALWDPDTMVVLSCTPIPALIGSSLVGQLREARGLEVFVQDDARALAIGQRWFGEATGAENFAAVQISTGIGAGLILDGRLFSVDGRFPEVGHMVVDLGGAACRCGSYGCWETIAAVGWLRDRLRELGVANWEVATPGDIVANPTPETIDLLDAYARNIGVGLANLATSIGLTRFVLHGEVVTGGELLLGLLRKHVAAQSSLPGRSQPTIEFSRINQGAALLGAAALPLVHAIERA